MMAFEELDIDRNHHERLRLRHSPRRDQRANNSVERAADMSATTTVAAPSQPAATPPSAPPGKSTAVPSTGDAVHRRAKSGSAAAPPSSVAPPSAPTKLLTWNELPHWLRDNHYIHSAYRPPSYRIRTSLRSIFAVHNETVNIQTHLLGGLSFALFALLGTSLSLTLASSASAYTSSAAALPAIQPLLPFLLGAVACLLCSATFHATSNVSPRVAQIGNQLDYLGIVCLITGSFLSSIRLAFRCLPAYLTLYTALIGTLGTACAIATLTPRFRTPAWRPVRAAMFVGLGLTALVPMAHGLLRWGWADLDRRIGATQMVAEGVLYTAGAGLYAARWPERRWPGKLDLVGTSHQIFHVLVVAAAWCHCWGTLRAMAYADGSTC